LSPVRTVEVFGFPISRTSVDELAGQIGDWANRREGHWIATLNLDYIARCKRDPEFRKLLAKADVFTADGAPILWACRQLDPSFRDIERTTGADLTPRLIRDLDPAWVAIIGGAEPRSALEKLGRSPDDYFVFDGKVELTEAFARSLADQMSDRRVVLVGLGCPKQEHMIDLLRPLMPNAVFLAIGGSMDMAAGVTSRAPMWMQTANLEWLYRLAIEPKRLWRRYILEYPPGAMALYRSVRAARRTASKTLPPS
jgi:N-acetylglucosaminyldiphosphoundecaprenol N-acetyl-beta-D-mannosaminyltransferase